MEVRRRYSYFKLHSNKSPTPSTLITVRWSASITLHGTTVSVSPAEVVPLVQFARYPNELGKSICGKTFASLQDEFPATIDFSQIVTDLNDSLKLFSENLHSSSRELGLANPIFNRHGDLFLELASRDMQLRVNGNGSVMGGRGVCMYRSLNYAGSTSCSLTLSLKTMVHL